ncbi:MAG: UvrB/UvrC motif-containing protein [Bacillota bacterium]
MVCQECGQRPATVHVVRVVNNRKSEAYLCEECARSKGNMEIVFNPLVSLLQGFTAFPQAEMEDEKCKLCGMSFSDFKQLGRMGCDGCYNTFRPKIDPVLKRVHGSVKHVGKVPAKAGAELKISREIERLRNLLQAAVKNEDYERAASLRDQIRELEGNIE